MNSNETLVRHYLAPPCPTTFKFKVFTLTDLLLKGFLHRQPIFEPSQYLAPYRRLGLY